MRPRQYQPTPARPKLPNAARPSAILRSRIQPTSASSAHNITAAAPAGPTVAATVAATTAAPIGVAATGAVRGWYAAGAGTAAASGASAAAYGGNVGRSAHPLNVGRNFATEAASWGGLFSFQPHGTMRSARNRRISRTNISSLSTTSWKPKRRDLVTSDITSQSQPKT